MVGTLARDLSEVATDIHYKDFSPEVLDYTKRIFLDTLGCMLGAYLSEPSRISRAVVAELGGKPEATVIGSGFRTNAPYAALANGVMVRFLDFNDIGPGGHNSEIIPAILAVAEREHMGGKEVLEATVTGYEIHARIGDVGAPMMPHGVHGVTTAAIAVPITIGRMVGLSVEQMTNAVSIALSANVALTAWLEGELSMMKAIGYHSIAEHGIVATMLARKGFTGPQHVVDHLFKMVSGDAPLDTTKVKQPLKEFRILQNALKSHPSQIMTQAPATATLALVKEHNIRPQDVAVIEITGPRGIVSGAHSSPAAFRPPNRETADHSTPYVVAAAILERQVTTEQYVRELWNNPTMIDLMGKVAFKLDESIASPVGTIRYGPARVEIRTKDGKRFATQVDSHRGTPQNPMTWDEVERKFRSLAFGLLGKAQQSKVVETVKRLERVGSIGELMELLVV